MRSDCPFYLVDIETVLLEIIPSSPIQRVDEGSRLTILCQASTGDFLHLAWQRRSKTQDLPTTLTRNKHNITSALTIEHARLEDADDYVCYGYGWTAIILDTVRVAMSYYDCKDLPHAHRYVQD